MNYWLHRIALRNCMNVTYPLLDNGYLSIGFSDFCDDELTFLPKFYSKNDDEAWIFLEDTMQSLYGSVSRTRYFLWRFLREMKKGDWVLVPSSGTFSIYEVLDDVAIAANDPSFSFPDTDWSGRKIVRDSKYNMPQIIGSKDYLDIGFMKKCKPISLNIPRSQYADAALTSRMKVQSTNLDISDLKESILTAIERHNKNKPINLKAELLDRTVEIWEKALLDIPSPEKFEKLVQWYFIKIGASSVEIPPKYYTGKEGDVDVVAFFENQKTVVNVQVKHYTGQTSDWAVDQITDYVKSERANFDEYHNILWVISSADSFSDECIKKAKENNVRLINGKEFTTMLLNVGLDKLENFDEN